MWPYDPEWAVSFEYERERVTAVLKMCLAQPLEHIGSTAVPGLIAKPIVDIVAVVRNIEPVAAAEDLLREIGWLKAPEPGDDPARKLSFCTPSVELRTHHMHVVEESSPAWRGWLAFRDHLRAHPDVAEEYGALKARLAEENGIDPNQRGVYRAGKEDWVRAVTERALTEAAE
jgi:GrpB-like predicted nucleotidyltransferase (UPF0157 family)